jgi:hypothetical protein
MVGRQNSDRMPGTYDRSWNETSLWPLAEMARYFFDFRAGGASSIDEDGQDLPDTEAAHGMAIGALSDAIRDIAIEGSKDQKFAIEVRDEFGPVLHVSAVLESKIYRKQ